MTSQICGAAVDLYAVLKNLQTLFAALVAFGAALVAFAGVRHSARVSYRAAQDSAKAKIEFDREQVNIANNRKQAATVTWMYTRAHDARRMMEDNATTLIKFEQLYTLYKNTDDLLRGSVKNFSLAINAMPDVYERSDLSKVTLEFITEMDEFDMENFFAVTQSIVSYDQWMRGIKKDLARWDAAMERGERLDNEDVEIMLRNEKRNIEYECKSVRGLEEAIAKRYREIRSRFRPELSAASPEDKATKPVEAATAS